MKKIFLTIFLTMMILPVAASAVLEIDFPEVAGVKPGPAFGPANWINYIFVFGLGIVGLAIIGSLVYAGFEWMSGAENPSKIASARDRIMGSVIGLIILLGSYVFLNTINPELVRLKNPRILINEDGQWREFYKGPEEVGVPLFTGRAAGSACASDLDCGDGLYCPSGTCVTGNKRSAVTECNQTTECASGYRCFEAGRGTLVDTNQTTYSGECSQLKALGEVCDATVAVACRGNAWCEPTKKICEVQN